MGDPAGEADRGALRLDFDRRLMLQFRGAAITSDAGLLAYRELDDTVGLTNTSDEHAIWPIRRFEKQLREGSLYSTPGPGGLASRASADVPAHVLPDRFATTPSMAVRKLFCK